MAREQQRKSEERQVNDREHSNPFLPIQSLMGAHSTFSNGSKFQLSSFGCSVQASGGGMQEACEQGLVPEVERPIEEGCDVNAKFEVCAYEC